MTESSILGVCCMLHHNVGRIDGQTDGWIDVWMGGLMDEWMGMQAGGEKE